MFSEMGVNIKRRNMLLFVSKCVNVYCAIKLFSVLNPYFQVYLYICSYVMLKELLFAYGDFQFDFDLRVYNFYWDVIL